MRHSVDWAKHYASPNGYRFWPNEELVRFASRRGFQHVLDVGCGAGGNARLWRCGTYVVGLDLYITVLTEARRAITDGAVVCGDVRLVPFVDASFDLVVDCMTSQHIPWAEHAALYREYRRVLKQGGWLWLFHMDDLTWSVLRGKLVDCDWSGLRLFPGVSYFCLPQPGALRAVVREAGFEPISSGLRREYQSGDSAHYTIVAAEVA